MTEEIQLAEQKHAICEAVTGTADLVLRNGCVHLQYIQDDTGTANGSELTAVLQYGQVYAAFPGDLAAQGVLKLVKAQDTITIWAVPHHGSRFSGTAEIYRLLRQKGVQYAVISAGQNNRYGHPHQEVLKWMEVNHISYRQTAEQGAVLFIL